MPLPPAPPETFTIKRAPRLVRYGLPCLVLLPLMALTAYSWFTLPPTGWGPLVCQLLGMLLLGILIALVRFQYPTILTIGPEQVTLEENDWATTVAYCDLKYLREHHPSQGSAYIELEPLASSSTRLRISSRFDGYERIWELLAAHVPPYDAAAAAKRRPPAAPLSGPARQVRRWEQGLALASCGALALQFSPLPYLPAMAVCLALPLRAAWALWRHQGSLHLTLPRNDRRADVTTVLWLPAATVVGYHLMHFRLVAWQPLWLPAAGVAAGFWLLLRGALGATARARNPLLLAQALPRAAGFGLAVVLVYNCAPSHRPPLRYTARVARLSTYYSKGTHYELTPSPWGPAADSERISISQRRYEHQQVGDTISLRLYRGRLGADWAVLTGSE